MKKTLLLCAAALFSLVANAGDGLVAVGANVIILPSSQYDGDIEWKAWTWVYNSQTEYGEWNSWNPNYNVICGDGEGPKADAEGRMWYEPGFDMGPKEGDINYDVFDAETEMEIPILWEEHTAPFSSDATYNGRPSYQWTGNSIMADIYVRRTFTLSPDQFLAGPVYLACGHDDAPCEYYINGELVFERTGFEGEYETTDGNNNPVIAYANAWNNDEYILLTDEQKALIKLGGEENVIAFHVHQNWGGAFADCGLYTKLEGGLEMGYSTPWEGKVIFNSIGGYNWDGASPSNNPKHPWSALYEAQEGDEYTFVMPGSNDPDDFSEESAELFQFKTPIKIDEERSYNFKAKLVSDKPFTTVIVKLGDNDDEDVELAYEEVEIEEGVETELDIDFDGAADNFCVSFDFGGGEEGATVTIKEMSLTDVADGQGGAPELWIGSHYFNYFNMHKRIVKYFIYDETLNNGEGDYREATQEEIDNDEFEYDEVTYEEVNAPEVTGRVETLAWTQADFDDSMWDDMMMPVGNEGYMAEVQSIWPGGDNTNFWIRRNFELDKINERLSYELNVCHDDVYETYVNGHLLQKNVGWTNGKNPVQVHIPAKYLNVGKNVIATYIQQNWGGKFYDCGIIVTEVNFEECAQQLRDVIEFAKNSGEYFLTNRMKADIQALIEEAENELATNKDAAEIRNYARELKPRINTIFGYSNSVKVLKDTWDICRKMEDKGYWGTTLQAATAALDTCATASDINKYLEPLRDARKATAMERHTEKYVGCVPEAVTMDEIGDWDFVAPKYYIYNVGAKNFLGAGESWGTHLAIEYISNPMMLIQATKDVIDSETGEIIDEETIEGAYYIETFRPNGEIGIADFMQWNGFIDCGLSANEGMWEIIPVEGKENVFNIAQFGSASTKEETTYSGVTYEPGCKRLLGLRTGDNGYAPSYYVVDTDMHDPNLETNQWMFITREEMISLIATASVDNPVDVSFLINNPGYDQRLSTDDWIFFNGSVWGRGGNHANFVLESYNTNEFQNYQELWPEEEAAALPAGTYKLMVQGYYRDGIEQAHVEKVLAGQPIYQKATIFGGSYSPNDWVSVDDNETFPLMPIHIEANKVPGIGYTFGGLSMPGTYSNQPMSACEQAANEYFAYGLYWNEMVFTISEDDPGHMALGIDKPYDDYAPGDWIVMDNWRIKYYGGGEIDPDAIKGVESDEINKTTTVSKGIYNTLGQRLSKIQKGVNIINGKKVLAK